MGHTRLGEIPKTRKWRTVVAMFSSAELAEVGLEAASKSPDVRRIASASLEAAQTGLRNVAKDRGLQFTFYLLTQLVLSARHDDWQQGIAPFGITLAADASIFDLTVEMQAAVDDYLMRFSFPTDVSEIAQRAAGEAILTLAGPESVTLFGSGRNELQRSVRKFSTKGGFSELGQHFFSNFLARYLNFFLSRITAGEIESGSFRQIEEISSFNDELKNHCYQSAQIVHDFCGEWYSKTEFKEGISLENTSRFMAVALRKLRSELNKQEAES